MAQSKPAPNLDLQRERLRQQMSRAALSRQTNVSRKALIDIEMRRTRVRFDTAARIAKALDVPITDVFDCAEVIG
jgi:DNA-binding XRE family transcriptional regulator